MNTFKRANALRGTRRERDAGAGEVSHVVRIRPLLRDDLPALAILYERIHRSGSVVPPPGLAAYFARTFLDHPWADPEVPSLVYEDRGRILGFIGSTVRRLRFDGQAIRLGCTGPFFADPAASSKSVGPFLLRRYMQGPQELTITDAANETVRRIWERFGGECLHLSSIRWTRLFRPVQCAADELLMRAGRPRLQSAVRPALRALDAVVTRLPGPVFRLGVPQVTATPLTPDSLIEHLPAVAGSLRVYPDYDRRFLLWLFRELGQVRRIGELSAMLVRDPGGSVLGWYVCLIRSKGLSQVLQLAAAEQNVGRVVDHLFAQARVAGALGLVGRLEPRLLVPLATRGCMLHNQGKYFAMIHSRVPGLTAVVRDGRALLTRMEGETWFGHWSEPFDTESAELASPEMRGAALA